MFLGPSTNSAQNSFLSFALPTFAKALLCLNKVILLHKVGITDGIVCVTGLTGAKTVYKIIVSAV